MRTLILGFLIFLCWLFFCRWYYVCQIRNQCGYQTEIVEDLRDKSLNLVDNGKNILEGYDQFLFDANSFKPTLNANNEDFISKVAAHLKANPDKQMTITGNYLPSEVDSTGNTRYGMFENIGLARADAIRKLLVAAGIDESRMKLDHNLLSEGDSLNKPISFNCFGDDATKLADANDSGDGEGNGKNTEETPEEYDTGGQDFSFTNMSFSDANFKYDSDVFTPGSAFKFYADSVKTFLAVEDDKFLNLVGHTCDLGSDSYNKNLGLRRAKSVKKYFEELGVKTKISTASEGENKPAYKNDSNWSRSKNRRVVVQIK